MNSTCSYCFGYTKIHARGLCNTCYNRNRKAGTLDDFESVSAGSWRVMDILNEIHIVGLPVALDVLDLVDRPGRPRRLRELLAKEARKVAAYMDGALTERRGARLEKAMAYWDYANAPEYLDDINYWRGQIHV